MTVIVYMLACVCVKREKEREEGSKGEGVVPIWGAYNFTLLK